MADDKDPNARPTRDPAKHSKKDPAKPTRAKAAREQLPPIAPALEKLLNPGIEKGTAGPGSQTGLRPPPDNSFDRRADFAAAHKARASTRPGFEEAPQKGYVAKAPLGPLDPDLARAWGIDDEEAADSTSPRMRGESLPSGNDPRVDLRAEHSERSKSGEGAGPPPEPSGDAPSPGFHRSASLRSDSDVSPPAGREPAPDLIRGDPRPARRLEPTVATLASQQSLERLLREGRPEFGERPWV
ncbi:MAG: hypothetical protein ACJ8FU_02735, partial [Xanthobacteraceae bacterium]